MSRRGLASMLVTLLLIGVPATALADGAGDNQYQDPLAAPAPQKKKATKKTTTSTPTSTQQTTATTPASGTAGTSASGSSSSSTSSSSSSSSSASQQELPRTGAPAGLIALAGATLAAAGIALRRRTAE